jgi:hypothetical protein
MKRFFFFPYLSGGPKRFDPQRENVGGNADMHVVRPTNESGGKEGGLQEPQILEPKLRQVRDSEKQRGVSGRKWDWEAMVGDKFARLTFQSWLEKTQSRRAKVGKSYMLDHIKRWSNKSSLNHPING